MILSFHPCIAADHQIIMADRDLAPGDISLIDKADVIILPQSCSLYLYQACVNFSALIFPDYRSRFEYPGKVGQSLLFERMGIPHPRTIRWNSVEEFKEKYVEQYNPDVPFLLKANFSHEGEGVYLVKDKEGLESALVALEKKGKSGSGEFISQEMIQTGGNVLRVVIMGQKTISYWKRPEKKEQIVTTAGKGARIDRKWKDDLQEKGRGLAEKLARTTGINLAAVDMVFSLEQADPEPMILEINYYFGRRGLGGSLKYYRMLFKTIQTWLKQKGFDAGAIKLV
jgi:ribosomal protein S6--L-glutamate ligase